MTKERFKIGGGLRNVAPVHNYQKAAAGEGVV